MKEQIKQALKNAPMENLEKLKMFYGALKIGIANDFEERATNPEKIVTDHEGKLTDPKKQLGDDFKYDVLFSAIAIIGCEEIIEIIEDVEEERKEEQGN